MKQKLWYCRHLLGLALMLLPESLACGEFPSRGSSSHEKNLRPPPPPLHSDLPHSDRRSSPLPPQDPLPRALKLGPEQIYLNQFSTDVAGWLGGHLVNLGWETVLPLGYSFLLQFASYSATLNLHQTFYRWYYLLPDTEKLDGTGLQFIIGFAHYPRFHQLQGWFWSIALVVREITIRTDALQAWGTGLELKLGHRFFLEEKGVVGVTPFIGLALQGFWGEKIPSALGFHAFRSFLYGGSFPGKLVGTLPIEGLGVITLQVRVGLELGISF